MIEHPAITRRRALLGLGITAASFAAPAIARAATQAPTVPDSALATKHLISFTLYGGNDGLNTLVPYRDPLYRHLRPGIGLPDKALLRLSDDVALHPALTRLMSLYQAGEVALIQDVGCPASTLSHFDAIEVWESASPERAGRDTGWYGRVVAANRAAFDRCHFDAAAISFDRNTGFARGEAMPLLYADRALFDIEATSHRLRIDATMPSTARALAELVNQGADVQERLMARLHGAVAPDLDPSTHPLDVQITWTEWLLAQGAKAPVYALAQNGYDTHTGLLDRHAALLADFDAAIARLRERLKAIGVWNDVVVLVHSEFGRRVAENIGGGTDHGTAGPVMLIGGRVRGGIYGQRASLDDLDTHGNLRFTTDFRRVYATITDQLWRLNANPFAAAGAAGLPIALA